MRPRSAIKTTPFHRHNHTVNSSKPNSKLHNQHQPTSHNTSISTHLQKNSMDKQPKASISPSSPSPPQRDVLTRLEAYLSKRDGVDKLLKISRYATKIILASSIVHESTPLNLKLKSFETSVGISRKASRLGKFIQDVNALRFAKFTTHEDLILSLIAYGGEGLYYFVEQFVWLGKAGLIDKSYLNNLQKLSAWSEFIGYIGSISLKVKDLRRINEDEKCLVSSIEVAELRGIGCSEELEKLNKVREKRMMKRVSIVQDLADGWMALADIRDGKGRFTGPLVVSSAGLLSALISTHKNWVSC